MAYFISFVCGVFTSLMVSVNGLLTDGVGLYTATTIIHLAGLLLTLAILLGKRERFRLFPREVPWKEYLGGVIGVGTVVANNGAFGGASVSAMVALTLLGQTAASIVVDQFGLLGMPKRPFEKERLAGYAFVVIGILVMLYPFTDISPRAVFLLLLGGTTLVLSRSINGQLTDRIGAMQATLYNFIMGLSTAVIVLLLLGRREPAWTGMPLPRNILLYLGGCMGVVTVALQNVAVHKVSAVYMTLLIFVGQIFASIFVDTLMLGAVSQQSIAGGICIACGLALNIFLAQRKEKRTAN